MRPLIALIVLAASLTGASAQELTCANSGNTYQVGDIACITACHQTQRRMARCERKDYGATWIYLAETCPNAMLAPAPRLADWIETPAKGDMTPISAGRLARAPVRQSVLGENLLSQTTERYLILAGVEAL